MAFKPNTTLLVDRSEEVLDPTAPAMIEVEGVAMDFNSANQQLNSLKEYFIAAAKRELMFKRFRALDDINLTVQKGDVFGILGTNGSGKSTLMKIVSGVLEPTEGEVRIHGNIAPLIELGAGFDYELTARENIYLNGALLGYSKSFIDQYFDEIVDFAEIRDFLDMPLKNYSSGMVSRIAFAIATVIIPEILIVDEVLSVGDFMFQQKCEKRIQSLIHEHGTTVLIVSHSSDQIERLCNKAIWIEKGHVRMVGTSQEVSEVYQAFGGHAGSAESEAFIFDCIRSDTAPATTAIENIAGSDRFATNALVANKLNAMLPADTVVLAPGKDMAALLAASNLAHSLGAIMLMSDAEDVPEPTLSALAAINPRKVLHIAGGASDAQAAKIRAALSVDSKIDTLVYEDADQLSLQVQQQIENPSKAAVVGGTRYAAGAATVAPAMAGGVPFFSVTQDVSIDPVVKFLSERNISNALVLNDGSSILSNLAAQLEAAGIDVRTIEEAADDDANAAAQAFLTEVLGDAGASDVVYITNQEGVVDAISMAPLVAGDHSCVLAIDHNNMDSMARAIRYLSERKGEVKRVVVLGSAVCFTRIDKKLFARAIAVDSE